jgi:tripartite-type tricarboxylate transporter receptor subunit TctC
MKARALVAGLAVGGCAALLLAASATAHAQGYPTRTVRVIVPMAAVGGSDTVARQISQKFSEEFGQQFVVENHGGGGGLIGITLAVKAAPDGYTLMVISGSFPATAAIHQWAFDPINNVSPIVKVGYSPLVLAVHPSLPARTTRELIALARAKPVELAYATPGVGSLTHLATELFSSITKTRMVHVSYKSTGLGMPDLLAGRTQLILVGVLPILQYIQTGRLRALAVTTGKRWYALPEVPTMAETLPGFEIESWFGIVAPKGTAPGIVARLNAAVNKFLQQADMKKNLDVLGIAPSGGTPEDADVRMRSDYQRWSKVVKEADIKPE